MKPLTTEYCAAALQLVAHAARETARRPNERPRAASLPVASESDASVIAREAAEVLKRFAFHVDELCVASTTEGEWSVHLRLKRTPT
jgi:hypothetical protein